MPTRQPLCGHPLNLSPADWYGWRGLVTIRLEKLNKAACRHYMVTYTQPTKSKVRSNALSDAIRMLTKEREQTAVISGDHVRKVLKKLSKSDVGNDKYFAQRCDEADIKSWESFRSSHIGSRTAAELTVAYLAGPEPSNDIEVLIELGIRAENIWAFENDQKTFALALKNVEKISLRGIKLIDISLSEYLEISPRRFDIIYLDACAPLPNESQKTGRQLASIFRYSSLAPLGVLITNFAEPDVANEKAQLHKKFSRLIAAYLFPKPYLDVSETKPGETLFSPAEHGMWLLPEPPEAQDAGGTFDVPTFGDESGTELLVGTSSDQDEETHASEKDSSEFEIAESGSFLELVEREFSRFYGCFLTRHIVDIASIIAPSVRIYSSKLGLKLIGDTKSAIKRADLMTSWEQNHPDLEWDKMTETQKDELGIEGLALSEPTSESLLFTLAYVGLLKNKPDILLDPSHKGFFDSWAQEISGDKNLTTKQTIEAIKWFYGAKSDPKGLSQTIRDIDIFSQNSMPNFCDMATDALGFYPAFAQLAHPAHCNFSRVKRYSYVAEGKSTRMYTDVIPFDECRYVHDWLSTPNLFTKDWTDVSSQLVFRMALDAIAKSQLRYMDDFLYGCNVVGIDDACFQHGELQMRMDLSPEPITEEGESQEP